MNIFSSNMSFRFGNDGVRKALYGVILNVEMFNKSFQLKVNVVQGGCPLLLSRPTLSKMGIILNFHNGFANYDGKWFELKQSNKSHFLIPLVNSSKKSNSSITGDIFKLDYSEDVYQSWLGSSLPPRAPPYH